LNHVVFVLVAIVFAVSVGMLVHAIRRAPAALRLSVTSALIEALPLPFDGFRVAILSDLHYSPGEQAIGVRRAVAYANAQLPDLVVLLGDYGTSSPHRQTWSRRMYDRMFPALGTVLSGLRASDGVLAVLGNHDYYAGAEATVAWMESLGFHVLRNRTYEVARNGSRLHFVGLDDVLEGDVSNETVHHLTAGMACTIALCHNPDGILYCRQSGIRLVLSGHTHGGQIVLPLIGAPVTRSRICTRRHPAGWVPNSIAPLFVSRGVGVQIPIRFRCPPEVVLMTLHSTGQHPV
jgi:predicted MPP superfamily phosphohydrolase